MKKFKKALLISCLAIFLLGGIYLYFQIKVTTDSQVFSSTVSENVLKILQLSTLQYNYTDVISYKQSSEYNGLKIPFTEKKFLIKYTGYIKAGTDLNNIKITITEPDTIHISLEHCKITDNVINEEDVHVYDEKESIFNQLKISDYYQVLVEEKKKTESKIVENGFLTEADDYAKQLIEELLKAMNFKNITIDFY